MIRQPPHNWLRVKTNYAHTKDEPLRVIISGFSDLPGDTILERRCAAKEHFDDIRKALM